MDLCGPKFWGCRVEVRRWARPVKHKRGGQLEIEVEGEGGGGRGRMEG